MLANAPLYVSLPTTDLPRARHFYETVLGLPVEAVGDPAIPTCAAAWCTGPVPASAMLEEE
jgi:catechol 2,3-dioxygenase-like lactoylglutathione lyase family enzyme